MLLSSENKILILSLKLMFISGRKRSFPLKNITLVHKDPAKTVLFEELPQVMFKMNFCFKCVTASSCLAFLHAFI